MKYLKKFWTSISDEQQFSLLRLSLDDIGARARFIDAQSPDAGKAAPVAKASSSDHASSTVKSELPCAASPRSALSVQCAIQCLASFIQCLSENFAMPCSYIYTMPLANSCAKAVCMYPPVLQGQWLSSRLPGKALFFTTCYVK